MKFALAIALPAAASAACTWSGPYPGEITATGDDLSDKVSLQEAQAECEKYDDCVGVDSDWYVGTKFTARAGEFRQDEASYGVTYLKACRGEEMPPITLPRTVHPSVELTAELVDTYFTAFKAKHNKVYENDAEHEDRKGHFEASLKRAQERNTGLKEHNFGVTKFSDMSVEEFKRTMLTYKPGQRPEVTETMTATARQLRGGKFSDTATDKDWRGSATTEVKDQGQCGSCWAFSTAEQVESAYAMQGGDLTELSIAQLVQCDKEDGGCNGGDTVSAYDYVQKAGGLSTESGYPYSSSISRGNTGRCDSSKIDVVEGTNIKSWKYATPECYNKCDNQDEETLAENMSTMGPASICVNAEPWQDYTTGTMSGDTCGGHGYNDLDHCVQLVGYSGIGGDDGYWIVRNSWAGDWGYDGIIRLAYGSNTCGLADEATFVTLE